MVPDMKKVRTVSAAKILETAKKITENLQIVGQIWGDFMPILDFLPYLVIFWSIFAMFSHIFAAICRPPKSVPCRVGIFSCLSGA